MSQPLLEGWLRVKIGGVGNFKQRWARACLFILSLPSIEAYNATLGHLFASFPSIITVTFCLRATGGSCLRPIRPDLSCMTRSKCTCSRYFAKPAYLPLTLVWLHFTHNNLYVSTHHWIGKIAMHLVWIQPSCRDGKVLDTIQIVSSDRIATPKFTHILL